MSWITPIKNTFIKFIVKGNNNGGGIDEDTLNSKLAQFYATTETKILNLVTQKLANYVLSTDFQALQTKVTTNTNNIATLTTSVTNNTNSITALQEKVNNLPTSSAPLSYIKGYITTTMSDAVDGYDINNGCYIGMEVTNLQVNNSSIPISSLKQYIVNFTYRCDISKWKNYQGRDIYVLPIVSNWLIQDPPTSTDDRLNADAMVTLIPMNTTPSVRYVRGDVTTWNVVIILSKSLNEILQEPSAISEILQEPSAISESSSSENTLIVESYS